MIATEIANGNGHRLLDSHELAQAAPPAAVDLPLELIDPSPRNPRARLVEVDDLAQSIRDFGLIQPLFVRRQGERYEILAGHRRYAAYCLLREQEPLEPRWRVIPAVVRTLDDERAYLSLITAQVHTAAWRPREEAAALEQLMVGGRTLDQVGAMLSRSKPWVSKRLAVYSDSILSGFVQAERISRGTAEELLVLKDVDTRRQFAERAVAEAWSPQDARAQVKAFRREGDLADVGRMARELHAALDRIPSSRIDVNAFTEMWALSERIGALWQQAQGKPIRPKLPTLEAAERVAGITPRQKERAEVERQKAKRRRRRSPPT